MRKKKQITRAAVVIERVDTDRPESRTRDGLKRKT